MLKKYLSQMLYDMRQQDQTAGEDDPAQDSPTFTDIQMPIPIDNSIEDCSDNKYLMVDA